MLRPPSTVDFVHLFINELSLKDRSKFSLMTLFSYFYFAANVIEVAEYDGVIDCEIKDCTQNPVWTFEEVDYEEYKLTVYRQTGKSVSSYMKVKCAPK